MNTDCSTTTHNVKVITPLKLLSQSHIFSDFYLMCRPAININPVKIFISAIRIYILCIYTVTHSSATGGIYEVGPVVGSIQTRTNLLGTIYELQTVKKKKKKGN